MARMFLQNMAEGRADVRGELDYEQKNRFRIFVFEHLSTNGKGCYDVVFKGFEFNDHCYHPNINSQLRI